jgi:hypothetical protein
MDFGEQEPALQATGRTATNLHGQSRPYPPFGTTCFSLSTDVFHPLHKPIECPPLSMEIHRCLPVLLSVLTVLANSTFEGTFYFSQAPSVVDIPHREEKKDLYCGIFPHFLNSPTLSVLAALANSSGRFRPLACCVSRRAQQSERPA